MWVIRVHYLEQASTSTSHTQAAWTNGTVTQWLSVGEPKEDGNDDDKDNYEPVLVAATAQVEAGYRVLPNEPLFGSDTEARDGWTKWPKGMSVRQVYTNQKGIRFGVKVTRDVSQHDPPGLAPTANINPAAVPIPSSGLAPVAPIRHETKPSLNAPASTPTTPINVSPIEADSSIEADSPIEAFPKENSKRKVPETSAASTNPNPQTLNAVKAESGIPSDPKSKAPMNRRTELPFTPLNSNAKAKANANTNAKANLNAVKAALPSVLYNRSTFVVWSPEGNIEDDITVMTPVAGFEEWDAAYARAKDGDRIQCTGKVVGNIVLGKAIELIGGEGFELRPEVAPSDSPKLATLSIQTSGVKIRDMTIKAGETSAKEIYMVEIAKGVTGVLLENLVCEGDADATEDADAKWDSSKDASHGIMVHEGAEVRLVGCTVSRASGCGLFGGVQSVPKKSKIPIKPCTVSICSSHFHANKCTGVWLIYARNCSFIKSRFTGNGHMGLYLDGTPGIRIEGCTVSSNRQHGIALDRPFTHLRKASYGVPGGCLENTTLGVELRSEGAVVRGCTLSENKLGGIIVQRGVSASVLNCEVVANGEDGIYFTCGGLNSTYGSLTDPLPEEMRCETKCRVEKCRVTGNKESGIAIDLPRYCGHWRDFDWMGGDLFRPHLVRHLGEVLNTVWKNTLENVQIVKDE